MSRKEAIDWQARARAAVAEEDLSKRIADRLSYNLELPSAPDDDLERAAKTALDGVIDEVKELIEEAFDERLKAIAARLDQILAALKPAEPVKPVQPVKPFDGFEEG